MEQHLKKRILGAFVTVIALAIAMPIVLDGSRSQISLRSDIPLQPVMEPWKPINNERHVRVDLEKLASGEAAEAVKMPDIGVAEMDDAAVQGSHGDRAVADTQSSPYAWTLQLGAFEQRENAHALRDRLRNQGYKAYVQEFGDDRLTRVYVGPELQRSKIEALQQKLRKQLKQNDLHIKRYYAES